MRLGVGNFDYTEVVSGIKEGEQVALLAAAAMQAKRDEQNNRIRGMGGMPGLTPPRGGAAAPGGAGGGAVAAPPAAAVRPDPNETPMLIGEIISVALGALRANKLRSLLTMLGIVIGVAAVIAVIALGNGAQKAVKDRISALGTTLLTVMPGQAFGMGGIRSGDQQKMTMDDAKAIEEHAEHITRCAARDAASAADSVQQSEREHVHHRHDAELPRGSEVRARRPGRCSPRRHDAARARVAVVGPAVAQLLGFDNPIALVGERCASAAFSST